MKFLLALLFPATILFATLQGEPGISYLSPIPGSAYHKPQTRLIFRFKDLRSSELQNPHDFVKLFTEQSGPVTGKTVFSTDGRTIIYRPDQPFNPGEKVTVHLTPVRNGGDEPFLDSTYYFYISSMTGIELPKTSAAEEISPINRTAAGSPIIRNGVAIPSNFPLVDITINDDPDSGLIFINNWGGAYYIMILDNSGWPVWYQKVPDRRRDFKLQKDGRLTMLVRSGYEGGSHIALDSTYAVVDTFFYPAGYSIDEHELQVMPDGTYFLIISDRQQIDMSKLVEGGNPNAIVLGTHVAGMDADDNNIFLWRSWDHFNVTDAGVTQDLTASYIESVHMNAIEIDHDGNLLISSRNLNEVSKIDYETGEFIWRLGGRNNQFIWVNDEYQISYQHDIRVLENGNYTVYDNGIFRIVPDFSRGLEVKIDTVAMTVTKVWEFVNDPVIASKYLGNVQRLPNGNTLINWAVANAPKLTEVRPDGTKAFEMDFVNSYECYRTFRFQWKGKAAVPYLVAESWLDRITLIFNKFGDPDVARYNIYGGADPAPDNLLATSAQPYINLINLPGGQYYYFRVTSTNNAGEESAFSNEEKVFVQSIPSGQNMVVNGDFTNGLEFWELTVDSMKAEAGWRIDSTGVLHMEISDGGDYFENILITYPNIRLVNAYSYLFEFDARASGSRIIEAEVAMQHEPYESYSRIGYTLLTPEKQHFRFGFSMQDPTDFTGAIVFRVGGSAEDVFIDNVSLKELPTGTEAGDPLKDTGYVLYPNFPNPFNPVTTIRYQLPAAGRTKITIYNLLGEQVKILADRADHAGIHEVRLDATGLSSGIYIYRIRTRAAGGKDTFTASGKMLLMR